MRIAVNLSARQFGQEEELVSEVAGALKESGLEPECRELELTESLLVEDSEAPLRTLEHLRAAVGGVQISIDDFGTGYSSLYRLKALPIERLKIDRTFVGGVCSDAEDAAITTAVIRLAHDLRLKVIAEGVETADQVAFLRERGCDEGQGYYFSRPVPADEFTSMLKARRSLPVGPTRRAGASGSGPQGRGA